MSNDNDIISRSRLTPTCFGELYERHARAVFQYALLRAGPHVAEDIMSETFLVAFDRRDKFNPTATSARPWLLGIATNLLKAHRRVEAQTLRQMSLAGVGQIVIDSGRTNSIERSESQIDAQIAMAGLSRALQRMKTADRDVLMLFALGDLDYDGIAAAMSVPVGTVRSRLNRARHQLQAAAAKGSPSNQEVNHGRFDPATNSA